MGGKNGGPVRSHCGKDVINASVSALAFASADLFFLVMLG